MTRIGIVIFLLLASSANAQNFQKEINDQVWKPFMTTFSEYNSAGFMAVHSLDLIRAPRDSKSVQNYDEYKANNEKWDKQGKESKAVRSIELRFLERIASATQGYEVGIYKTTVTRSGEKPQSFYGKFHVVLRKEKGVWKILVDSDSSEGGTINEASFLQASALE